MVLSALAVFVGAGLGALARWALSLGLNGDGRGLPLGTLAANLLGGYLVGVAIAWLGQHPELPPQVRLFLVTGCLGGLTTFSTYSAEVVLLIQQERLTLALATAAAHLLGSLALTALGIASVRALSA